MNRRAVGIRLVAGLIVAGGLVAGSLSSAMAGPGQLVGEGLTVTARFEKCTEGSDPKTCKPIDPETPSKRGGKPKKQPRGGSINEPPKDPPTGGRIRTEDPPKADEPTTRVIRSSGGDSQPFIATHLAIPVVESNNTPVQAQAAKPVVYQPVAVVTKPVVTVAPDAGVGPELGEISSMPGVLAALATLFGAAALYTWRRSTPLSDRH